MPQRNLHESELGVFCQRCVFGAKEQGACQWLGEGKDGAGDGWMEAEVRLTRARARALWWTLFARF